MNEPSAASPFSSGAAPVAQRKPSLVTNPARTKPDVHSPFSKEPLPRTGRSNSMVNVPSADSPFKGDAGAPGPAAPPSGRGSRANVMSEANVFSDAPFEAPRPAQRDFKAIAPSDNSPFVAAAAPPAPSSARRPSQGMVQTFSLGEASKPDASPSKASVRVAQPAGGAQSINLFDAKPAAAAAAAPPAGGSPMRRGSSVGNYSKDSPFNTAVTDSPRTRAPPKANVESAAQPAEQHRRGAPPKANVPARDSPWSSQPEPPKQRAAPQANVVSAGNPLAGRAAPAAPAASPAPAQRAARQAPGGTQTLNIFG